LDKLAQGGEIQNVKRVVGAPETPDLRSGDYRFVHSDGSVSSADLLQPKSGKLVGHPQDFARKIITEKSGQAQTVIVRLRGKLARIDSIEAEAIAKEVLRTPGHTIDRIVFVKDDRVLVDRRGKTSNR